MLHAGILQAEGRLQHKSFYQMIQEKIGGSFFWRIRGEKLNSLILHFDVLHVHIQALHQKCRINVFNFSLLISQKNLSGEGLSRKVFFNFSHFLKNLMGRFSTFSLVFQKTFQGKASPEGFLSFSLISSKNLPRKFYLGKVFLTFS